MSMTGGVVEDYKVSVLRPEGVTVAEMNKFIRTSIVDLSWEYREGLRGTSMRRIIQHPIKVSREHHEHTHRKQALID